MILVEHAGLACMCINRPPPCLASAAAAALARSGTCSFPVWQQKSYTPSRTSYMAECILNEEYIVRGCLPSQSPWPALPCPHPQKSPTSPSRRRRSAISDSSQSLLPIVRLPLRRMGPERIPFVVVVGAQHASEAWTIISPMSLFVCSWYRGTGRGQWGQRRRASTKRRRRESSKHSARVANCGWPACLRSDGCRRRRE